MPLVPQSLTGKIQFYEAHIATWVANAVGIGSSAPEIATLQTLTENARAALTAQEEAQATAKTRTAALRDAVDAMANAGSDVIIKIRAKAATDGNVIYQLANIPAPALPSPVGPPGTPTGMVAVLNPDGSLDLKWTCDNPVNSSGTIYHIYRQENASGPFTFIGGSGSKTFLDATVPAGVGTVVYKIQAVRSTALGTAGEFLVRFGTSSSGTMTASVEAAPKLAA